MRDGDFVIADVFVEIGHDGFCQALADAGLWGAAVSVGGLIFGIGFGFGCGLVGGRKRCGLDQLVWIEGLGKHVAIRLRV